MNPSSSGWIDKYLFILEKAQPTISFPAAHVFYSALREVGFVYGFSVRTVFVHDFSKVLLTEEEISKVNTLHALLVTYFQYYPDASYEDAIQNILQFYTNLIQKKTGFSIKSPLGSSKSKDLEHILSQRVEKNKALEKYNFERIMTYALLFIDVLAYQFFLKGGKKTDAYAEAIELKILQVCYLALQTKNQKTAYDILLIDLFKASEQYAGKGMDKPITIQTVDVNIFSSSVEKQYVLDLCCLAVWNDFKIEDSEISFLNSLNTKLGLPKNSAVESLAILKTFASKNSASIQLFQYKHPVKQLYNQSTKAVKLLILRNKNRLVNELSQSKELVLLLSKSTYTDLNTEEKNKVKEQLLDVCKTIPSLTIFLLPGGSLLLPLLVKFIPQLLPSAFNDNKIPKK
ncbi:MAG: hypothetical protein CVU03_03645 [Bacteroidetes bacterium HGW-Bacteroidetes-2]|jgi:hypothetical protein|nr:MAG: hypothetical protein CVU03_03645 [Bacteroidetes bacterium HGW-Bacteroidetes-2]